MQMPPLNLEAIPPLRHSVWLRMLLGQGLLDARRKVYESLVAIALGELRTRRKQQEAARLQEEQR